MPTLPPLPEGFELPALPEGFQLEGAAPAAQEDPNKVAARQWLEAHPAYKKQGAMDYARMAANGATFGFADNAVAGAAALRDYLTHGGSLGDYYDKEKALQDLYTENARKNTGMVGTGLELAGSVLPTSKVAGVASKVKALSPFAASAATGATAGALQSLGDDQDPLTGAGLGLVGGAAGHGLVSGASKLAGVFNKVPPIDKLEDIKKAADAARAKFTSAPVTYSETGIQKLTDDVNKLMQAENYNPRYHTGIYGSGALNMISDLKTMRGVPLSAASTVPGRTPMELHRIEQVLADVAKQGGEDGRLAQLLRGKISEFMRDPNSMYASRGNSAMARAALDESNDLYTKFYKDTAVQEAAERAADRAAKTGSGGNRENTLRQEIGKLKDARGDWTPDELAGIQKTIEGSGFTHNQVLRLVGKASPEGNGLSLLLHLLGAGMTSGHSLPFAALGIGAKAASEKITKGHVADLSKIIRAGGSRSSAFAADNKVQRGLKKARPTVAGLLGTGGELY